jgi:hypothetical protein
VTYLLVALTAFLALLGAWRALAARGFGFLLYPAAALASCAVVVVLGSAWVDAKALAIASPAVVVTAFAGVSALVAWRWRPGAVIAGVAAAAVAGGVLWSNALAYGEVNPAPRERLAELERIGRRIAGGGPTLMTDYEPYGARYFLRDADPEGASELRRRQVPIRAGGTLPKGRSADLDERRLDAVLPYRTLVVRRSPLASRPPLPYRLVWSGRYYEVWQRPATGAGGPVLEHLPIVSTTGTSPEAAAQVRRAARTAGRSGRVAAAPRAAAIRLDLARGGRPSAWRPSAASPGALLPAGAGEARGTVSVPVAGRYSAWVGGSFHSRVKLLVDGKPVGSARHELAHDHPYVWLGEVALARGCHLITLRYKGPDLHPGTAGEPRALGPVVLAPAAPRGEPVVVRAARARELCELSLDWVEALPP